MIKPTLGRIALAFSLLAAAGAAQADLLDNIKQARKLRVAIERSPYHRRRLGHVASVVDTFEIGDLERLPVMTKAEMMDSFDDVVTDRRIRLADVERHLAGSVDEPSLLLDEYVCLASGGSSGLRGVFVHAVGEYLEFGSSVMRRACSRQLKRRA